MLILRCAPTKPRAVGDMPLIGARNINLQHAFAVEQTACLIQCCSWSFFTRPCAKPLCGAGQRADKARRLQAPGTTQPSAYMTLRRSRLGGRPNHAVPRARAMAAHWNDTGIARIAALA